MKVFISYSVHDTQFVRYIADQLKPVADKVFWWDDSKELGKEVWPSIFSWIDQSDLVLVLITDETVARAMSVGNEVGHAKAKEKTIIPLVAPDIKGSELGCLSNVTYEKIDRKNPGPAMEGIIRAIQTIKTNASATEQQKQKEKEEQQKQLLVLFGIVGLICYFASKS